MHVCTHAHSLAVGQTGKMASRYVNEQGRDFDGGDFVFLDADADRAIMPRCGRLVRASIRIISSIGIGL